jgi:hypothetical protein
LYGLCIDLIFKRVKAGPQQVLLTVCFASALYNHNCIDLIFKRVKAGPQQVLLTVCFASALYNNNCLAFILTSYLKSVAAAATNCEKGKTGAKRRNKKVTPLFERLPSSAPPLRPVSTFLRCGSGGAAKGPKNQKKIVIFVKAVTKTGASVWPGFLTEGVIL